MERPGRRGFAALLKLAAVAWCCCCGLSSECPADGHLWVTFDSSCYYFLHGQEDVVKTYSIEEAQEKCHSYGLLKINSKEENDFLMKYSSRVWKGTVDIWLDMYFDPDNDSFVWQDQKPMVYTNWEESVNDQPVMDICAVVDSGSGKWVQVSCQDSENGVVCETQQGNSQLLSALVILSIVVILGISAAVWFLSQKHNLRPMLFTSFEYYPPFQSPKSDETILVEAEETEAMAL
ncbi:CD302 antigen-like [Arapaima gigas]